MPSATQTAASSSSTRTGVHHGCRAGARPDRAADALAEGGDDRVVQGRVDVAVRTGAAHVTSASGATRPAERGAARAGSAAAGSPSRWRSASASGSPGRRRSASGSAGPSAVGGGRRRRRRRRRRSASAPSVGVLVGVLGLARRLGRRRLLGRRRRQGRLRGPRRAPRRRRTPAAGTPRPRRPPCRAHHRGPGLGRVGAAEVRRQPAVELLVALAAHVHDRGRQLRGVAGEPGRRRPRPTSLVAVPVLPAAGRPSPSAAVPVPDSTTCCRA